MSNATELLERALEAWDFVDEPQFDDINEIMEEIRAFLAAETERDKGGVMNFNKAYGMNGLMIIAAARYCVGRRTYISGECADWILSNWDDWPEKVKNAIQRDLEYEFDMDARNPDMKVLGDDCDKREWEKVRALWGNNDCGAGADREKYI